MVAQISIDEAKIAAFCRKWNIRELSLFGSVLRKDFNPKSDVDVLLTPRDPERVGLDQWLGMIEDLKQIFGREIDLHSRESIEEICEIHTAERKSFRQPKWFITSDDMAKTNRDYLYDILDSACAALKYIQGMDYEAFRHDLRTRDAVIRRLEIVGEATRRLEESFKSDLPEIPWRKIIGFRNIVAHEYDKVELRVVWRILQDDLPKLASVLREWLEKNPPE